MNETNGAITNGAITNGSHTTNPAESSSMDAPGVNGQASPIPVEPSLTSENTAAKQPSTPPTEKVLDESLEQNDLKISITVAVHSRSVSIMNVPFSKTFYDGLESLNRGILFSSIKQLLEQEVYQAVATKINRKAPFVMPETPSNGQQQKGKVVREPIPPYTGPTGEDEEPELSLHEWPSVNDCLKANKGNTR